MRADPRVANEGVWTLGSCGGCLSWGTVVRAEAGRAAEVWREGVPAGEVMPPTPLAPPMRRPGGPPGLLGAGWEVCRPFSPTSPCPRVPMSGGHLSGFLFLPPPPGLLLQSCQLPAELGVIRSEGDLGSDYLGWKLAPCVFFNPAPGRGGGGCWGAASLSTPRPSQLFTNVFGTSVWPCF